MVHFNYLEPCFTPSTVHEKPPQAATSGEAARSEPRYVLQPTQAQAGANDTGGVELEWLENPVHGYDYGGSFNASGLDCYPWSGRTDHEVPFQPELRFLQRTMKKFQLDRDANEREPS